MKKATSLHSAINALYCAATIGLCLILGHFISEYLGGLPRSLYGLILFTLMLHWRWIDANRVKASIAWGLRNMGVCFVPAGVGIIEHFQLVKQHGLAIVGITFVTSLMLLTFVAYFYRKLDPNDTRNGSKENE
ncbi:CidA/LrgA family protein [Thalassotalea fusca]